MGGARVAASWTMFDGRISCPSIRVTTTREDGSFVSGRSLPTSS